MKDKFLFFMSLILIVPGCSTNAPFHVVKVDNPAFSQNILFKSYEDSSFHKFKALREKYQLDTIFQGEKEEFKRILLLRHWIHKTIPIGIPPPGDFTAEGILDEGLKGVKFWCSYFMIVHNEIMTACGFVPRVINAGEGVLNLPGQIGHHGTNEIWSNTYNKWFFSDAMYDSHFEKNGIPLSALEIRDEYFKNKAADIKLVNGPERKSIDYYPDQDNRSKEIFARIFTWIAWFKQNDIYSNWDNGISYLIMYEDGYFKTHQWIRSDGKPHWIYDTKYLILTNNRKELYWTPNTITSKVAIIENKAKVELNSVTPFLKSYQMKEMPDGDPISPDSYRDGWKNVSNTLEIDLKKDKNEIVFRTINLEGVTGPEHKIIIER